MGRSRVSQIKIDQTFQMQDARGGILEAPFVTFPPRRSTLKVYPVAEPHMPTTPLAQSVLNPVRQEDKKEENKCCVMM